MTDPDNEKPVSAQLVQKPHNGKIELNERDGSFTYIPNKGFSGLDEFTFKVKDPGGLYSKPETAEINVTFKMKDLRGGAEPAGFLQADAFGEFSQRRFGGRPQQIKRSLGLHIGFPLQQITSVPGVVKVSAIFDKPLREHERLFRVVGDRASLHIRRDGLLRHCVHEPSDRTAVIPAYVGRRHALRRHAQRVAQRESGHGSVSTIPYLQRSRTFSHHQPLSQDPAVA